jgi:MFS transporter, ACS family, hexuronate transporter
VIGAIGLLWAVAWLVSMRKSDFAAAPQGEATAPQAEKETQKPAVALSTSSLVRRFIVLIAVVMAINTVWHFFRVWLPLILQEGRGYPERFMLFFVPVYYIAADLGCMLAGWTTLRLQRFGISTGFSRWLVFAACSLISMLSIVIAFTPASYLLIALLMILAGASLGLFPCYYALSQEISVKHQGKITGILGFLAWMSAAPIHKFFGRFVDTYHSYDLGIALAGCFPMLAAIVWLVVWDWNTPPPDAAREEAA